MTTEEDDYPRRTIVCDKCGLLAPVCCGWRELDEPGGVLVHRSAVCDACCGPHGADDFVEVFAAMCSGGKT